MLKYENLSQIEREMVNAEIRSNYSATATIGSEFKKMSLNVHSNLYCCNCFRLEKNCCCDKIEGCLELDEDD
jgi:hypothetical protein